MTRARSLAVACLVLCAHACCPNNCNGKGDCNTADCECKCRKGFIGGDCSQHICPYGNAWSDQAVATDVGHIPAECSNRGLCDRSTGLCTCFVPFTGADCSRNTCPLDCNLFGRCVPMGKQAAEKDRGQDATSIQSLYSTVYVNSVATLAYKGITDTFVYKYNDVWDATMMHGCVCDIGYEGPDCSLRKCPYGDDPLTGTVRDAKGVQFDEKQEVTCKATGGTFTLSFRGMTTEPINFDDPIDAITAKFNALDSTGGATVSFAGITSVACTSLGNVITISFGQDFGDVPLVVPDGTFLVHASFPIELPQLDVIEKTKGTKENAYCSNRGVCDQSAGICTCSPNFGTSDGKGKIGDAQFNRGDCGYASKSITSCPGEVSCSGHGLCQGPPTYHCVCRNGWQGGDCSERACLTKKAWYDKPIANGEAHQNAECSNMGLCDRSKGKCACFDGFEGDQCEFLKCPGTPACTGHGKCMTMAALAGETAYNGDATDITYGNVPRKRETWDFDMVQGCLCDEGYNGYDCSLFSCPVGDDPKKPSGQLEKQVLKCKGDTGQFALKFRQSLTPALSYLTSAAKLKAALEALPSIGTVDVHFTDVQEPQLVVCATCATKLDSVANLLTVNQDMTATVKPGDTIAVGYCVSAAETMTVLSLTSTTLTVLPGHTCLDFRLSTYDVRVITRNDRVCTSDGVGQAVITFSSEFGNLPDMTVIPSGVESILLDTDGTGLSAQGSKQSQECSGRGLCNTAVGICKCFKGYSSSDGQGNEGERGDCGFIETLYADSASELANTS
jgi:hypothetical protein